MISQKQITDEYCLLFPGQGAQKPEMFAGLISSSAFQSRYDIICHLIDTDPLVEIAKGNVAILNQNRVSSALVILASTLSLDLFRDQYHTEPAFLSGYSVGLWTSLYAANVISFIQLMEIVTVRAKLMDECLHNTASGMIAVIGVSEDRLASFCHSLRDEGYNIGISNYNCPGQFSVSGTKAAIETALLRIETLQPKKYVELPVSGAWHCSLLKMAGLKFRDYLKTVSLKKSTVPIIDNVSGNFLPTETELMKDQLADHLFSPVLWEKGIRKMIAEQCKYFIEVGFGETLTKFGFFIDRTVQHKSFYC